MPWKLYACVLGAVVCLVKGTVTPEWTTLLWCSDSVTTSPYNIWINSFSVYNNPYNLTPSALLWYNSAAYRNTLIDDWANKTPETLKVSFRNKDGVPLFTGTFAATGTTLSDWFSKSLMTTHSPYISECDFATTYPSYKTEFTFSDSSLEARRYQAGVLESAAEYFKFIIAAPPYGQPQFLPATQVAGGDCYFSFAGENPLVLNATVSGLYREYCSAICREAGHMYGAVHTNSCSCLSSHPGAHTALSSCTYKCEGNAAETCGGENPPAITFNYLQTDIDTADFDTGYENASTHIVRGSKEITLSSVSLLYGFDFTNFFPATYSTMAQVTYRTEACAESNFKNNTIAMNFTLTNNYLWTIEPIAARCLYIFLYGIDVNPIYLLNVDIHVSILDYKDGQFITAAYMSIEAKWSETTTTTSTTTAGTTTTTNASTTIITTNSPTTRPTTTTTNATAASTTVPTASTTTITRDPTTATASITTTTNDPATASTTTTTRDPTTTTTTGTTTPTTNDPTTTTTNAPTTTTRDPTTTTTTGTTTTTHAPTTTTTTGTTTTTPAPTTTTTTGTTTTTTLAPTTTTTTTHAPTTTTTTGTTTTTTLVPTTTTTTLPPTTTTTTGTTTTTTLAPTALNPLTGGPVGTTSTTVPPGVTSTASVNTSGYCHCDCWVYNLLYGDSPYNNLTYGEIEVALENVTKKIEQELSVNVSELSSTLRKLTSATDGRSSATAMGYALGVALLSFTVGAIVLADVPKLLRTMKSIKQSICNRSKKFKPQSASGAI